MIRAVGFFSKKDSLEAQYYIKFLKKNNFCMIYLNTKSTKSIKWTDEHFWVGFSKNLAKGPSVVFLPV